MAEEGRPALPPYFLPPSFILPSFLPPSLPLLVRGGTQEGKWVKDKDGRGGTKGTEAATRWRRKVVRERTK